MFSSRAFLVLLIVGASTAPAATFVEVGDFSDTVGGAPVFDLDFGLNTISGVLEGGGSDYFEFGLPLGGEFVRREVTAFEFGLSPSEPSWTWATCNEGGLCFGSIVKPATPLPIDLGTSESGFGLFAQNEVTCIAGCAYTIELEVGREQAAVPEPTTWTLLATGLAGAIWRRKKAGRQG